MNETIKCGVCGSTVSSYVTVIESNTAYIVCHDCYAAITQIAADLYEHDLTMDTIAINE